MCRSIHVFLVPFISCPNNNCSEFYTCTYDTQTTQKRSPRGVHVIYQLWTVDYGCGLWNVDCGLRAVGDCRLSLKAVDGHKPT
jgi:hypothetical protein